MGKTKNVPFGENPSNKITREVPKRYSCVETASTSNGSQNYVIYLSLSHIGKL